MQITVYNGSGADHADRFDGKDYFFPAGAAVTIPAEAAQFLLGMGQKDKDHLRLITRLGWAPTGSQIPKALERLNAFLFEECVEEDVEPVEIASQIERPVTVPTTDALVGSIKGRTRSILQKAS